MFPNHFLTAWPMISEEQDQRFNRCMELSLRAEDFLLPEHPENFTTGSNELHGQMRPNSCRNFLTLFPLQTHDSLEHSSRVWVSKLQLRNDAECNQLRS